MPQYNQVKKTVVVPDKGTALRVWDNPHSVPYKNLTIAIQCISADSSKVTAEVFFGGEFKVGSNRVDPYTDGSTHSRGVSQGTATAAGTDADEVAAIVYSNTGVLPANVPNRDVGILGFPVVLELKNSNTTAITVDVIFISETLSSNA